MALKSVSVILCVLAVCAAPLAPSRAQRASTAETCLAANGDITLGAPLPKVAALVKANKPVKIVAIGSSSTVGLWMNDPAKTYQGRMKSELERLIPGIQLDIISAGRNGDTIPGNVARFEQDVFAHQPDLVIWQLGGNDFTWGKTETALSDSIADAVRQLRATGADVVMMDQQYTPVILSTHYAKMQGAIADVARGDNVALFPRFDMLHKAVMSGVSIFALSAFDGLHMSGDAYDCVGRALARAIVAAVR
ncbi:MAG: SGNH/GDSL hydrolase family protein [Xanthobacteraceae bacterium]|nr:SGNH/GDSL hydrolase family protein [Xanthobacteraceae bacterium]